MSIERCLTRNYNITFVDARIITNEAKLSLQIDGYATPEQEPAILERAIEIYLKQPQEVQDFMNDRKEHFDQTLDLSLRVAAASPGGRRRRQRSSSFSVAAGGGEDDDDDEYTSSSSSSNSLSFLMAPWLGGTGGGGGGNSNSNNKRRESRRKVGIPFFKKDKKGQNNQ